MKIKIKELFFFLLDFFFLALILFLPFSNFTTRLLIEKTELSERSIFIITHFYEPFILVFFLIALLSILFFQRKEEQNERKNLLFLTFLFIFFLLLSLFLWSDSLSRGIEGFRTSYFYFFIFFIALTFSDQKRYLKLRNFYLVLVILISVWAVLERFFPYDYWKIIVGSGFGWGNFLAGGLQRSASVFGGPLQLSSYLLPAFFILIPKAKDFFEKKRLKSKTGVTLLASLFLVFLALNLAFSRAAVLGLAIGLTLFVFLVLKNKKIKIAFAFLAIFALFILSFSYYFGPEKWQEFLRHGESQYWHMVAKTESLNLFNTSNFSVKLFGNGLGSHGPLAIKYSDGLVSESWYLQLLLEIGILGLFLWSLFICFILYYLLKIGKKDLALALISVLVMAVFLHPFADNPAMAMTLFILIGAAIFKEKN